MEKISQNDTLLVMDMQRAIHCNLVDASFEVGGRMRWSSINIEVVLRTPGIQRIKHSDFSKGGITLANVREASDKDHRITV